MESTSDTKFNILIVQVKRRNNAKTVNFEISDKFKEGKQKH